MGVRIALAGNPNSGKSTLFNSLTGSNQYVGNWPGVTVEKKEGNYKKDKEIVITDLPGIYSLSPYTLEEVVSRDYLLNELPDVIIDVIDASNIERNLYLATQLAEIGIPMVLALNMMDIVEKNKDSIDIKKLEQHMGCKVVEISALKNRGLDSLIDVAVEVAKEKKDISQMETFNPEVEKYIKKIEDSVSALKSNHSARWYAIKLFEADSKISDHIVVSENEQKLIDAIIEEAEEEFDDDGEGIITDARYEFVSKVTSASVKKGRKGLTTSDKIDRVVTNRILALPIFAVIMTFIYKVAIDFVGGPITDWVNDVFFGEMIGGGIETFLTGIGTADWLISLVVDGIIAGVGGVLGFLPIIATLYLFLAILEDIGYMSRIAFILDRIFRKFGLSGKSFIPILIGTGCSVPGIMATRTIENDNDRRMTIVVASYMPCGAKMDIIALFGAAIFVGKWWFAPISYFIGIGAVIITGVILKKTSRFHGDPAPFVMELPEYHAPSMYNVFKSTFDRCKSFVIKAGTIILIASVAVWLLSNISTSGEFHTFEDSSSNSILAAVGNFFAPIFSPLGFGNWMATVASVLGLVAKEIVVSTYGVVAGLGAELGAEDLSMIQYVASTFTTVSAMSFMVFNQLTIPCFAAVGAIRQEMNDSKWTAFTLIFQFGFSYVMALMVYQFGRILVLGESPDIWTGVAVVCLLTILYFLFRKNPNDKKNLSVDDAVAHE